MSEAGPFGAAYMAKQTAISDPRDGHGHGRRGKPIHYGTPPWAPLGLADHDNEIKDLTFI